MFDITFRRASAVPRELRIIPIEATVILGLCPAEGPNPPYTEPLPVNTARESFEGILCHLADIPVIVIRPLYRLNKVQLRAARAPRSLLI